MYSGSFVMRLIFCYATSIGQKIIIDDLLIEHPYTAYFFCHDLSISAYFSNLLRSEGKFFRCFRY